MEKGEQEGIMSVKERIIGGHERREFRAAENAIKASLLRPQKPKRTMKPAKRRLRRRHTAPETERQRTEQVEEHKPEIAPAQKTSSSETRI